MLVRSHESRVSEHNSSRASIHNEHIELNVNQAFQLTIRKCITMHFVIREILQRGVKVLGLW